MAAPITSGAYSATPTVIDLVNAALRVAQVIGAEETATGAQLQNSLDAMFAMTKGWQASGIHVWCEEEGILFLQPGQTIYQIGSGSPDKATLWDSLIQTTLTATALTGATSLSLTALSGGGGIPTTTLAAGDQIGVQLDADTNFWTTVSGTPSGLVVPISAPLPSQASQGAIVFDYAVPLYRPLRVMGARRYNYLSKIDLPVQVWARLDYQAQPNKYARGIPTAFFYDPQTGSGAYQQPVGQWNSWPTPQDNTNAMRFTAQRPIQDIGTLANIPDFPVEWNAALKWNLALEIGPENGTPLEQLQIIVKQAERWYQMAAAWDREPESVTFGVAWTPGQRRG
jgi:hypothetical protein